MPPGRGAVAEGNLSKLSPRTKLLAVLRGFRVVPMATELRWPGGRFDGLRRRSQIFRLTKPQQHGEIPCCDFIIEVPAMTTGERDGTSPGWIGMPWTGVERRRDPHRRRAIELFFSLGIGLQRKDATAVVDQIAVWLRAGMPEDEISADLIAKF
jgi:hypothetical protein